MYSSQRRDSRLLQTLKLMDELGTDSDHLPMLRQKIRGNIKEKQEESNGMSKLMDEKERRNYKEEIDQQPNTKRNIQERGEMANGKK